MAIKEKINVIYLGPEEKIGQVRDHLPNNYIVRHTTSRNKVQDYISNCDVIFDAYMGVEFDSKLLKKAIDLKLFITGTTGYDHVDVKTLNNLGVEFKSLKNQSAFLETLTPAAEHSWLLLLACARKLRPAIEHVLDGQWNRNQFPGIMLREKTLGIIGCGRNGQWMSKYASAFGMTNYGYDPHLESWPDNIIPVNLEKLLSESDFVTIHVPLNEDTKELIGKPELKKMKEDAILINTSRGDIIVEDALKDILEHNDIGGAGLDVLTSEPDITKSPIYEYAMNNDDVIITPHIGGFSPDAIDRVIDFSCQRIVNNFNQ